MTIYRSRWASPADAVKLDAAADADAELGLTRRADAAATALAAAKTIHGAV